MFSLIVMRMSGAIGLNPVFGRSNVPNLVKGALILTLSLMLYTGFGGTMAHEPSTMIEYGVMLLGELMFGIVLSFAMELSMAIVQYAASIMDYVMGLSMAQVYDPQTHAQTTVSSGIYNAFFILLLFATNGHLRIIRIFYESAQLIPFGAVSIRPELAEAMLTAFRHAILLGLQLAFPLIAIEMAAETAVGILMRMIPQINVFSVNFQLKIIAGLLMMLFLFSPMADKLNVILEEMYISLWQFTTLMG